MTDSIFNRNPNLPDIKQSLQEGLRSQYSSGGTVSGPILKRATPGGPAEVFSYSLDSGGSGFVVAVDDSPTKASRFFYKDDEANTPEAAARRAAEQWEAQRSRR